MNSPQGMCLASAVLIYGVNVLFKWLIYAKCLAENSSVPILQMFPELCIRNWHWCWWQLMEQLLRDPSHVSEDAEQLSVMQNSHAEESEKVQTLYNLWLTLNNKDNAFPQHSLLMLVLSHWTYSTWKYTDHPTNVDFLWQHAPFAVKQNATQQ